MTYLRIAAVALTILFAALLIWLYGIRTTPVWAAAMAAFLGVLYLATVPLRRRQERALRVLGLDRQLRALPETHSDDAHAGPYATPLSAPQTAHAKRRP